MPLGATTPAGGYWAWTSTLRLNSSRILLNEKIGVTSIYKVIDVYVYLDVM